MDSQEEEFLKRLQATFRIEAEEHIQGLTSGLLELEKTTGTTGSGKLIETIFREAHSLKGAARSVNMKDVESVCQVMESTFGKVKNEGMVLNAGQFDLLHKAVDTVTKLVADTSAVSSGECRELITKLKLVNAQTQSGIMPESKQEEKEQTTVDTPPTAVSSPPPSHAPLQDSFEPVTVKEHAPEERSSQSDTVRIATAKLDPLFLQAEQMIQSKIAAAQRATELRNVLDYITSWSGESGKWNSELFTGNGAQIKEILNRNTDKLHELADSVSTISSALEHDQRVLGRMIDDHLDSMKSVLMLPVAVITEGFPKLVRDLSRSQGKEIDFTIQGKEIEVDKRILEELKDPLIHLIRNCVDHGIKNASERNRMNKSSAGSIALRFSVTENRRLEILLSDDGAGIDLESVRTAAVKSGTVLKESVDKLTDHETQMLIFHSGVSTSRMITDISGRGLGLAIVREKAESLGGSVSVESSPGTGTTFRMLLPLTLSTLRAVFIRSGEYEFAVSTAHVERAIRISRKDIRTVEGRDTISYEGAIIALVNLAETLGVSSSPASRHKHAFAADREILHALVLVHSDKRIAVVVDDVLEEYQILIKELGKQLQRVRNISGATVLGSGRVVPVLHVADLIASALRPASKTRKNVAETTIDTTASYILVADDSITSRTLIKNILDTAGYHVTTAVDGADAFIKLLAGTFDLVVSDVDMPRMNGFELTAKIRNESATRELPVVLVTALESPADREHGIDVGASAYIVKSSFDQSNLLEVVKRLL